MVREIHGAWLMLIHYLAQHKEFCLQNNQEDLEVRQNQQSIWDNMEASSIMMSQKNEMRN